MMQVRSSLLAQLSIGESAGSARRHFSQPAVGQPQGCSHQSCGTCKLWDCCGGLTHCGYTRRSPARKRQPVVFPHVTPGVHNVHSAPRAPRTPPISACLFGQLSLRRIRGQPARTSHWPAYADELVRSKLRGPTSSLRCTWQCVAARPSLQSSHLSHDGIAIQAARGPPR